MMALGINNLFDLDKNRNTINPAIIVIIAVLVPDWNIPHVTAAAVIRKNILSNFNLEEMPKIRKATADALALQPYVAASLNVDQYLIRVPALSKWVLYPLLYSQLLSVSVNP